ncbi:P-loop NTPase fold protein [Azospirillum sp. B506]|uniref:KAP family P-loop NTPase fold protein n=1 Tax=Azospirillum sp. B506 TaxID=137721 RepID=UPI0006789088|nr:P-loop NTPase fold protein [Azospirillum sp. B506]
MDGVVFPPEAAVNHRPDRPIKSPADDRLGRDGFVARLARALVTSDGRASGVVVGLTGPWGSGKSSLLNLLQAEIERQHPAAVVVRFDPWLVSGRDDVITQFFAELLATITMVGTANGRHGDMLRDLGAKLAGYAKDLAPAAGLFSVVPGVGMAAAGAVRVAETLLTRDRSLAAQHRELADMLTGVDVPIVVLIDELDRVEDAEVRAVAQLVRAVADFPGISYLLAYDRSRVIEALGDKNSERGAAYLEKIVQLEIPLPVAVRSETQGLFTTEFEAAVPSGVRPDGWRSDPRWTRLLAIATDGLLTTPRDSRRVCGMYAVLAPMVVGEVDWLDLLGYCILLAKAPAVVEAIRRKPRLVVRDAPVDREADIDWVAFSEQERAGPDRRLADLGVEAETPLAHLLALLFPRLRTTGAAPLPDIADSLGRHRTLMTVLRLGLLPGAVSRHEITRFLAGDEGSMLIQLQARSAEQTLGPFLDRLQDVYREIADPAPERTLRILGRISRDIDAATPEHSGECHARCLWFIELLHQAVKRCGVPIELGARVLTTLLADGHLDAVATVLRHQGSALGLFGDKQQDINDAWLSPETVKHLAGELAKVVLAHWKAGTLLSAVYTPEPLFLTHNLDQWSEDCRAGLTERVRVDDGALRTVTLLLFGYGMMGFAHVNTFLDAALLQERLAAVADADPAWAGRAGNARWSALNCRRF